MPGREWSETGARLSAVARRDRIAARLPFDHEHCDGCKRMLARGSLRMVCVAGDGRLPEQWEARCGECIRKGPPRPVGDGTDVGDGA